MKLSLQKNLVNIILLLIAVISLPGCTTSMHTYHTNYHYTASPSEDVINKWQKLQPLAVSKLRKMQNNFQDAEQQAWVELALISKQNHSKLASELLAWREQHPSHPANNLLSDKQTLNQLLTHSAPQHIAVLLPLTGKYASLGKQVRRGILDAYYANLAEVGQQNIQFYNTSNTTNIFRLYQQSIQDGADFVIGPLLKSHVEQIQHHRSADIPTLSLNYPSGHSSSRHFYSFGLLPEDEVRQIVNHAHESGLKNAIVITPNSRWGKRLAASFEKSWKENGGKITTSLHYTKKTDFHQEIAQLLEINPEADQKLMRTNNNKQILQEQRRHDFDVIFLFASPQAARTIVPLLHYNYINDIPIYASSSVLDTKNRTNNVDLNGVTICDLPHRDQQSQAISHRLYALGKDAYRLSKALKQLHALPAFPLYGSTGSLSLSANQQIRRHIPCRTVQNAQV